MNKSILPLFFMASVACAEECNIEGDANLWAYDMCFSVHETDDSIHPGVIECVDEAQYKIREIGECSAKSLFKERMCQVGTYHDSSTEACIDDRTMVGPSVRDGGIE